MQIGNIKVPDSQIIQDATELARTHASAPIFNHSMRSWLLSAYFAQRDGIVVDGELLAVADILHDLGLDATL